ncbi:glycosyltransferase family protein 2 [Actinidia rufa]|uniref:Glycosyltransferase family protein 2 n=1 Tax=Actinidia rufa TaxID=165716 RepID=A0A7J0H478_9ERIC|nr:glycosyltransferase family protein 2 [Actinidia rufa]
MPIQFLVQNKKPASGTYLQRGFYQLQKYRNADSFVLPVDPKDKEKWGNSEHRLPYVSKTSVSYKNKVQVRDEQWWRALSTGYVTQWAKMHPQKIDALFYAHSMEEVKSLGPLLEKFRSTVGKQAYIVVSGGIFCPCEDAATALNWPGSVCRERRFKIFDLGIGEISGFSNFEVPVVQAVYSSMRGLIKIHNPSVLIAVSDIDSNVMKALKMASESSTNGTTLVLLPRPSVSKVLWMADLQSTALPKWNKMHVSVNIITQNRVHSLAKLLKSLADAYYLGDEIPISFNMDSLGGLIQAISESWYPSLDDDYMLLLEDDIEVSPTYYLWIKYALLAYHYDPQISLPELASISLYTPRLFEVVKENPKWNATEFFEQIHPNTPYLHQLPCSWGAVFFPQAMEGILCLHEHEAMWPCTLTSPNQTSLSTNHMERGDHIAGKDNAVKHDKSDFEVPLLKDDFRKFLPGGKLPPASKLPSLNLFNQVVSLKEIKAVGAYLGEDVIECKSREIVVVDHRTGLPSRCASF